jgi:hypothetical protein
MWGRRRTFGTHLYQPQCPKKEKVKSPPKAELLMI